MNKFNRRKFIQGSLQAGLSGTLGIFAGSAMAKSLTPKEVEGPFYPIWIQKDKDFDLTQVEGTSGQAIGRAIFIQGQVWDSDGNPLEDAIVDLWQANAAGRYRHPFDSNTAPLDPNFQGWAIVPSAKDGRFRFKTIYPGEYPASRNWTRPPHIHFKISKKGYAELITQMYFPDHPLNQSDLLLQSKSSVEQQLMIAEKISNQPEIYLYNIVLKKL